MCKFRVNQTMYYIYTYVCIGMYNRVCVYIVCVYLCMLHVCVCARVCANVHLYTWMYVYRICLCLQPENRTSVFAFFGVGWDGVGLASLRSVALAHIHDATQRTSSVVLAHILYAESW